MGDVISFRPSDEEKRLLAQAQKKLGARSTAEAVRKLIVVGAARVRPLSQEPVFQFRVPKKFRGGATITSREIDEDLYGEH